MSLARNGNPSIPRAKKEVAALTKLLNGVWRKGLGRGSLSVQFDTLLHTRGTDFRIWRNEWDTQGEGLFRNADTVLFKSITTGLMAPKSGVNWIEVTSYGLEIHFSEAVEPGQILDNVVTGCLYEQFQVTLKELVSEYALPPRKWRQKAIDWLGNFALIKVTVNYHTHESPDLRDPYTT